MKNSTIVRGISGTVFLAIVISALVLGKYLFASLLLFITAGMMLEFYKITLGEDFRYSRYLATFAGLTLFSVVFAINAFYLSVSYLALPVIPLIFLMISSLYIKDRERFWKFSHMYAGILYIAVPMACTNLLVFTHGQYHGIVLLAFFCIIWSSDVGAYLFGITLGKKFGKKLFEAVSPNKSWAGFWGGLLTSITAAITVSKLGWLELPLIHSIILGTIMHIAGVYGDLFESQWKRCFHIKDSGNLMPGHGGFLDRFDSALLAIPAGGLYLLLADILF